MRVEVCNLFQVLSKAKKTHTLVLRICAYLFHILVAAGLLVVAKGLAVLACVTADSPRKEIGGETSSLLQLFSGESRL